MNRLLAFVFALTLAIPAAHAVDHPTATSPGLSQTYPYSMIGQLLFDSGRRSYIGSGTLIRARTVVTAGHNVWHRRTGFSTEVEFSRGRAGTTELSNDFASHLVVLGGYRHSAVTYGGNSIRTFARDLGGVLFASEIAEGQYAGWWQNPTALQRPRSGTAFGYGAESHSGDDLLSVFCRAPFYQVFGAFFECDSITVEGGMSGGPMFIADPEGEIYVAAVIVSGSDFPPAGGVRVINAAAARFFRNFFE